MKQRLWSGRTFVGALMGSASCALACSSPELAHTRFSCATNADCAPGQACAPVDGELACRSARAPSRGECPAGVCTDADSTAGNAALLPGPALDAPVALEPGREAPDIDTPLVVSAPADERDRVGAPLVSGAMSDGADAGPATTSPSVRFDFEAGLDGWQEDENQIPVDTLDGVEQSTARAHHGAGALRMVFDGEYTPVPAPPFSPGPFNPGPFNPGPAYGVYEVGAPPPGMDVSLWMMSTAPGVSAEVYSLSAEAFTILATVPLLQNEWREIRVTLPLAEARQFGIRLHTPLDIAGFVYLDEIRW